jgi:XTP/dITP diphosphohydrolase
LALQNLSKSVCWIKGEGITMKLLVATNNPGKLKEYQHLLHDLLLEITGLHEEGIDFEPEETGSTFEENAILKARAFAQQSRLLTLADDSGLEIDALGGAPGVHSARYGGTRRGEDERRCRLVLRQLDGVPWPERTARFRCVVAVAVPGGRVETAKGTLEGIIAFDLRGEHGFGYDPIFFIPDFDCTLAQLPPEMKNRISHRARAAQAALPIIQQLI